MNKEAKRNSVKKWLKRCMIFIACLLVLFVAIILFIRSRWGQEIIVDQAIEYLENKTQTEIDIKSLYVTFDGNIYLEGLYVEDQKQDTLLYSNSLEASIGILPLVKGEKFNLKSLDWSGVTAKIEKNNTEEGYNFQFIIDAFVTNDSVPEAETSEEGLAIELGDFNLSDINVVFDDEVMGIEAKIKLGNLETEVQNFDLDQMIFEVEDLELSNTSFEYLQSKPFEEEESQPDSKLPLIKGESIRITEVNGSYKVPIDQLFADFDIKSFTISSPVLNLEERKASLNSLSLQDAEIGIKSIVATATEDSTATSSSETIDFQWPDWNVETGAISIDDTDVQIALSDSSPQPGVFDPNHIKLQDFNVSIEKIMLTSQSAGVDLQNLSFTERSGIKIHKIATDITITKQNFSSSDIDIQINESSIAGDMKASYQSIEALLNSPNTTTLDLNIPKIQLAIEDSYAFQPDLQENEYVQSFSENKLEGQVFAKGTLGDFSMTDTFLNWGETTSLEIAGTLQNVVSPDSLFLNLDKVVATTKRSDVVKFIDEKQLSISIPDSIALTANVTGKLDDLKGKATLASTNGSVKVQGSYRNQETIAFDANLDVDKIELDKILMNEQLGTVSFTAQASGKGTSVNTLDAKLTSDFQKLGFNGYDFSALELSGELKNGKGTANLRFKDENLNLKLGTDMVLDSIAPQFDIQMQVIGADLNGLGITQKVIKTQFDVEAFFKGNADSFAVDTKIDNATVVYNQESYSVNPIRLEGKSDSTNTNFTINSRFLKGNFKANAAVTPIMVQIEKQLKQYISQEERQDSLVNPVFAKANFSFQETPVLSEVFIPGLKNSDTLNMSATFDEKNEILSATVKAPRLTYQEGKIDSLLLRFEGNKKKLNFTLDWDALEYDPIFVKGTNISGEVKDKKLLLNFDSFDQTGSIAHLQSELSLRQDTLYIHVNPQSVLLDRTPWTIKPTNKVILSGDYLYFDDFVLNKNEQRIQINSDRPDIDKKHVNLDFSNFNLANVTSFLNPDEVLAAGVVNGSITVEEPLGDTGFLADLQINDLSITEVPLGNLKLDASSQGFSKYDLNLSLNGKNADLSLQGEYRASETGAMVDMNLDLTRIEMSLIEDFTEEFISKPAGSLSGTSAIKGNITNPDYEGVFHFNKTSFLVDMLNTTFVLPEENIKFDKKGIYFDQFTIKDADKSSFVLDGAVKTKNLSNPSFDVSIKAKNFQLINATKEDNELFYGKVNASANLTIKGNLNIPKIRGSLKIDENSDFTLVVPETELEIKEREGVVLFVNRENPDAILTRVEEDQSQIAMIKGFDINTNLSVGKGSLFKIIIDERTEDNIQVRGTGDFIFGMEPNGRMSLSGRYDISDGKYKASLYDLVKIEFDIAPDSYIKWSGDPYAAELDVRAIYEVETSPAPLLGNLNGGGYTRDLEFLVYLNVDGELLEPEISFALDMTEDQQALSGGQVYGRIQQLNEQESELNKQVFSLLVFNRFYGLSGNDGSAGGPASIVRDNVNKLLSGQLNNFSNKLIGKTGVNLNFELDSYNAGGSSPSTQTDLQINAQKKLFDDRLIVSVGSSVNVEGTNQADEGGTPVIGNVSLQYLLSEDGKYRMKAFRKNEFESIVDGQLIVTGIAFIFNREFDKFRELWSNTAKEIEKEEKKKKNAEKKTGKMKEDNPNTSKKN